jgi:bilirubin oxidase
VFWGLAGFLYVEDPIADALPIPRQYGVDDFPLIVQDRNFQSDGTFAYFMAGPGHAVEARILGKYILVNGVINPYLDVPHGMTRLRLLNGSDARRYRFAFQDGRRFHLIASDGGFLDAPVAVTSVDLAPAERAEILVDFAQDDVGARLKLVSQPFPVARDEHGPFVPPMSININGRMRPVVTATGQGLLFPVMEFRVSSHGASRPVPGTLVPMERIPEREAHVTRTFDLDRTGEDTINGLKFDMSRIDARVDSSATEVWSATNYDSYFSHSFHVHGVQFNVLDRTRGEQRVELPPLERGWKDTVLVHPDETVRIISRFDGLSGMYMFHCHVILHEDRGMMGTFLVTDGRTPSPERSAIDRHR